MPCIASIKLLDGFGPETPDRHDAGELNRYYETDHEFGNLEVPAAGKFLHFNITDRSVLDMQGFNQKWNRVIDMTVTQGPNPAGNRRIDVRNNLVNASGTRGQWTTEITDNIIAEWNARHPLAGLFTHGFTADIWDCEGVFTVGEAQEFERVVVEFGVLDQVKRNRWVITPAGMANIISAGGTLTGTGLQFAGILHDRLTD